MFQKDFTLDYAEFYITNVCNLNCNNCNRFNNFNFTGHERWQEYKKDYVAWSKVLDLKRFAILGGEPFANPDLEQWLENLIGLWPDAIFSIVTNGTYLDKNRHLYKYFLENKDRSYLELTLHGENYREEIMTKLFSFLEGRIKIYFDNKLIKDEEFVQHYNAIKGPDWPDCKSVNDLNFIDEWIKEEIINLHSMPHWIEDQNGVKVMWFNQTDFWTSALIHSKDNNVKFHNSDPIKAVKNCVTKYCHHFSKGKLSKCGVAGIMPDFVNQFVTDLSEQDKNLVFAYKSAEHTWQEKDLKNFFHNLKKGLPIDNCKFCPENYESVKFETSKKKIKLVKNKLTSQHN